MTLNHWFNSKEYFHGLLWIGLYTVCRSDVIDYLIHPLGVQYNKGCLEMWPSQIVEDSPRFMSQLRASVASLDRWIILRFRLGKYWSWDLRWQASRPEIEGNGLLLRVWGKKMKDDGKNKIHYLNIGIDVTERQQRLFSVVLFPLVNSSNRNAGG